LVHFIFRTIGNKKTEEHKNRRTGKQKNRKIEKQKNRRAEEQKNRGKEKYMKKKSVSLSIGLIEKMKCLSFRTL
jgi:hypothetical protein